MSKKKKIVLIVTAVILTAGIVAGALIYRNEKKYTNKSEYGETSLYTVLSDNELSFDYSCPYARFKRDYEIVKENSVTVTQYLKDGSSKKYSAVLESAEFKTSKEDVNKLGSLTVKIKINDKFTFQTGEVYQISVKEGAIVENKKNYSFPSIEFAVSCEQNGNAMVLSKEDFAGCVYSPIKDAAFKFERNDGRYYLVAYITADDFTKLNASALANKHTGFAMMMSKEDEHLTNIRLYTENLQAEFSYNGAGKIRLSVEITEHELLVSGQEYDIRLCDGLLTNDGNTVVSTEFAGTCTFVG